MRRPTIPDIARAAGVSVATVNRVIAARVPVRQATARRVAEAAQRIGYHAGGALGRAVQSSVPEMTFGFVLHKRQQAFYRAFAAELERQVTRLSVVRGRCEIAFAASQSPGDVVAAMQGLSAPVIAATAVNHVAITEEVQALKVRGVPVIAMLSEFAIGARLAYVGLDNMQMGRGAARMLSLAASRPGRFAVFVGGHRWHGHDLREAGFRGWLREHAPDRPVLDAAVNLETRQLTYEATLALLARHPDLAGIYVTGGGMEGAIAALREERAPGEVALVLNELTPESRAGLIEGYVSLVCATPLDRLCCEVIGMMLACRDGVPQPGGQSFLSPTLYLPEFL